MVYKNINLNRFSIVWLFLTFFFIFPLNAQAAAKKITFEPVSIEKTILPGQRTVIPISFNSTRELGQVELWVVPELQPFITLSQYDFVLKKGQSYRLNLVVDIKWDHPSEILDGTIHIRKGKATIPNTIKVKLNIIGHEEINQKLEFYAENDNSFDLDGDGLLNSFEIHEMRLQTLPDDFDSDNNGISDGQEDNDRDGLINIDEQKYGTNPFFPDTDNDKLSDYDEINTYLTNPLLTDSDNDKLDDGDELALGTDPNNPDSNANGVLDGDEIYVTKTISNDSTIEIEITGQGYIAKQVQITHLENDALFNLDTGTVLAPILPIEVISEKSFDKAIIKFILDPEIIANYEINNFKIVHFDEALNTYVPLDSQGINLAENYIWAETTHFSIFAVIDELILNALFNEPFNGNSRGNDEFIDIVFTLDSSGSMTSNDPYGIRKSASKILIDALSIDDQAAVVDFDNSARTWQTLTKDKSAVNNGIDRVDSSGGTNIGAGVAMSIQEILERGLYDNKFIILLTDGQGSYSTSYTQQAADNGIVIHVIGLGSGVNHSMLAGIASGTGGNYYQVSNASQLIDVFNNIRETTQDTDGDGLPDYAEINGMRFGLGLSMFTDPALADTDGDGLTDGEEMGAVLANNYFGGNYYQFISNPNKEDSDNDEVGDYNEVKGLHTYPKPEWFSESIYDEWIIRPSYDLDYSPKTGSNPLRSDSDSDNISDYYDRYPNISDWYGKLRKGDIILVGHNDEYIEEHNWDWINKYLMNPWSHTLMYMGDEKTLDAHPDRPSYIDGELKGGTNWSVIHDFLYNSDYDRIVMLRVKDKSDSVAEKVATNAETYIGTSFGTDLDLGNPESLYCAEMAYLSWKSEGVDLSRALSPWPWVRPDDLYNDWKTEVIKEIDPMQHKRP